MLSEQDAKSICKIINASRAEELAHRARERWARAMLWIAFGGLCVMLFALAASCKGS